MLKALRHYGHPYLKEINGFLNLVTLAFGFFNLFLGAALFFNSATTNDFFIITGMFSYQFWGASFFAGGVFLLAGHLLNNWAWMRYTIIFLLFNKFIWLAALSYRQFEDFGSNTFLLLFFTLATIVQVGLYIYFPILERLSTWKN